jgi:hypothetical protein
MDLDAFRHHCRERQISKSLASLFDGFTGALGRIHRGSRMGRRRLAELAETMHRPSQISIDTRRSVCDPVPAQPVRRGQQSAIKTGPAPRAREGVFSAFSRHELPYSLCATGGTTPPPFG